jgi:selenocysteine lyase/cysteine desulfurase
MEKRAFLKNMALLSGFARLDSPVNKIEELLVYAKDKNPADLAIDEVYWAKYRKLYRLNPAHINLESGYYNILPEEILEQHIKHIREVNLQGAYYMRTAQVANREKATSQVAELMGCSVKELTLTRNTTESLDMIIGGYPWKSGDEAVMAQQDYPAMLDMFKMVAKRYGVKNNVVSLPLDPVSDDEILALYAKAITPKTKLLLISHVVNISGQVMPVKKICQMAHEKGVEVMVDGAHAVAQLIYTLLELGCDYYGASLHKWLAVPLGVGMLYVKKEKIAKIWPLIAEAEFPGEEFDIKRLSHLGTHPVHAHLAISSSIEFYKKMGPENKLARLRYLQNYWTSRVRNIPNVLMNTPKDPERTCAIANVGINGMSTKDLATKLLDKYGIYTVGIDNSNVHGCRITVNVFTSTAELDVLVKAIKEMATV